MKYMGSKNRLKNYIIPLFNHQLFWEWARRMSLSHDVYVSEYSAPEDFVSIWEKPVNSSLTKNTGSKKAIEKLFIWRQ